MSTPPSSKRVPKFTFSKPDNQAFKPFEDKAMSSLLDKWCMKDPMSVKRYSFDQKFSAYEMDTLLLDLFNDANVLYDFKVLHTVKGQWGTLGGQPGDCTKVSTDSVQCSAVSMEFFDRLYDCGAIRKNGSICGCMPEDVDGYTINQELGKVMLLEDSDHYDIFTKENRKELLFRVFQHLTLGGPLNQYEDEIGPYFDITKTFYKSMISVAKDAKSNQVFVTSLATQITELEGLAKLFPTEDHPQNFLYVVVNPTRREVVLWYHAWCG
eukprot:m.56518 g.56518  ORF g.56518 m.56518 type:complete len:267 (+) comp22257_c2_seq1:84-884(+)